MRHFKHNFVAILLIGLLQTAANAAANEDAMQRYGLVSMKEDGTIFVMTTLVRDGQYSESKNVVRPGDANYEKTKADYSMLEPGKSFNFVVTPAGHIEYKKVE